MSAPSDRRFPGAAMMRIDGFRYQRMTGAGAELLVALAGSGPPVVLLHGFPQHHLAWRHVAPRLAGDHRVICIDSRGSGAIRAVCDDHRASAFVDPHHDAADRAAGAQLTMPVLAAWEDPEDIPLPFDPTHIWARWAPHLTIRTLPGGHCLPEGNPDDLTAAIADFAG